VSKLVSLNMLATVVCSVVFAFACALGQDCADPASHYRQGVVSLTVKKIKKDTGRVIEGNGTGFVVSPPGYVLTADHLVARDSTIDDVKISGAIGSLYAVPSPLRIVDEDKGSDVALLKFLGGAYRGPAMLAGLLRPPPCRLSNDSRCSFVSHGSGRREWSK
jgi:S1-C subfamily serine protease